MPMTPETLPRHELVGLRAEVVSASNPDLVGLAGEVVVETTRMLGISEEPRSSESTSEEGGSSESGGDDSPADAGATRVSHVPKADATFEFDLPAGADGETRTVTVAGEVLDARPARRTEQTGDSQWR